MRESARASARAIVCVSVLVAACGRPSPQPAANAGAPSKATASRGPELRDGGARPVASTPEARSLDDRAREAYAAIAEGRFAAARSLLEGYEAPALQCSGEVSTTRLASGGMRVEAPRGLVTTDASGAIVAHEVVAGCLKRADESLRITTTATTVRIAEGGHVAELTHEAIEHPRAQSLFVSPSWALAVDIGGDVLAMNRRDGAIVRDTHGANGWSASNEMFPVGALLVGDRIVIDRGAKLSMLDASGLRVDVRGCPGALLDAARTESGEHALHVTVSEESTDTRLCLVRDDGTTRAIAKLGSATCGLATAVSCPYALQASTPRLLGFGSMRGAGKLVDVASGRALRVPLPRGASFDGGSPGGFFRCGTDELCFSFTRSANGDTGVVALAMNRGSLAARPWVAPHRAEREDAWCALAGLPVPKAVCDAK